MIFDPLMDHESSTKKIMLIATTTETGWYNPNISNGGNAIHHPEFFEAGSEAIVGIPNTELGRHSLIPCEP